MHTLICQLKTPSEFVPDQSQCFLVLFTSSSTVITVIIAFFFSFLILIPQPLSERNNNHLNAKSES